MIIAIILLSITLIISMFFCVKFALTILRVQEAIEESLDIIDVKYSRLSKILEIPIFYNSPEVKSVIQEIEDTRDALLYIANQLANSEQEEDIEEDFEQDSTIEKEKT